MEAGTDEDTGWVDRLCTLVARLHRPGATIQSLFIEAAPDLSDRGVFLQLIRARLAAEPTLVAEWEGFSDDTRSTPNPYLRGTEVGTYDEGFTDVIHFDDPFAACAEYIYRRAKSVLG